MKRIFLMVLNNILFAPYWLFQLCMYGRKKDTHTEQERFELLKKITKHANKGGRVTIQATGMENLPEKDGFIIYPNHQGLYDVLAFVETCTHPFSVVMKKEVKDIPFLKQVFAVMKAKSIDSRCDKRSEGRAQLSDFCGRNQIKTEKQSAGI